MFWEKNENPSVKFFTLPLNKRFLILTAVLEECVSMTLSKNFVDLKFFDES
ncbi:hypothetical protein [uncultured Methanobrevibacter sp.]|uniref:hypothetical protein n=1 Tax=uncultured Methanobrevibacter sp. TaxID=253161 RepID=UPI0025DF3E25|nr:hypothetical protein [uncultured Methanobrevibacter sp.]